MTEQMHSTNLHKAKPLHPEMVAEQAIKRLLEGNGKK